MFSTFSPQVEDTFNTLSKNFNDNIKFYYDYDYINVDKNVFYHGDIDNIVKIIDSFTNITIIFSEYFIPNYIKKSIKDTVQVYKIFNSYLIYAKKDDNFYPFMNYDVNLQLKNIINYKFKILKSGKIQEYKLYKLYIYILEFTKKLISCKNYIEKNINKNIDENIKQYVNICDKFYTLLEK